MVPIYDAGEVDGHLYLAMRYVDGSDLRELLRGGPLEPARAIAILPPVALALDTAHTGGSCTGTSSPRTSCSTATGTPTSRTSG